MLSRREGGKEAEGKREAGCVFCHELTGYLVLQIT
jgi:hypothetical protein